MNASYVNGQNWTFRWTALDTIGLLDESAHFMRSGDENTDRRNERIESETSIRVIPRIRAIISTDGVESTDCQNWSRRYVQGRLLSEATE